MAKNKKVGYHIKEIRKGTLGEISKLYEELEELEDAIQQKCKIMASIELSDLYGAIEAFAKVKFNLTMDDLKSMSEITKRAFLNKRR